MTPLRAYVDGIGLWSPTLPGWEHARAVFRGQAAAAAPPAQRPAPALLAPAERRRAPDTVALALEVAAAAVAQAGRAAADLPSVFVSAHGDLGINDYMCATLVEQPTMISPTRFHNSVHNAAAGYWTIGTGCMKASTALAGYLQSFAAGLLEAATQCATDGEAVLLVGYDVAASGPLASVNRSRDLLAAALVLSPTRGERSVVAIDWMLQPGVTSALQPHHPAARALARNAMADALPLFEALAIDRPQPVVLRMPLSPGLALQVQLAALA